MENNELIKKLSESIVNNAVIDKDLYPKFNVKRGLRNEDGSGVLVGLTKISAVIGNEKVDEEILPLPGRLSYRGYDVKDLVKGFQAENRPGFEETTYLLLFGRLPNKEELVEFNYLLGTEREVPEHFNDQMILQFPSTDIMNKLARSVLTLYSVDKNPEGTSIENNVRQCIELIAKFPALTAYSYHALNHKIYGNSLFIHKPSPDLSTAENFLQMLREDSSYSKLEAAILDLSLVLHAEHGGGNNSSFTTHVVTSSGTDTYSAISAAIGSLKGPKHGGANAQVMDMMEDIKKNVKKWDNEKEVEDYLIKMLKGQVYDKSGLIYGIGHAVYTLSDPRAELLKDMARDLAKEKGRENEFALYENIEKLAPEIVLKAKNKVVSPNVDFFSGFVYDCLNIPRDVYTPIFAMARIAGWSAHRIEEILNGGRIIRPAYKNICKKAEYAPLSKRK